MGPLVRIQSLPTYLFQYCRRKRWKGRAQERQQRRWRWNSFSDKLWIIHGKYAKRTPKIPAIDVNDFKFGVFHLNFNKFVTERSKSSKLCSAFPQATLNDKLNCNFGFLVITYTDCPEIPELKLIDRVFSWKAREKSAWWKKAGLDCYSLLAKKAIIFLLIGYSVSREFLSRIKCLERAYSTKREYNFSWFLTLSYFLGEGQLR